MALSYSVTNVRAVEQFDLGKCKARIWDVTFDTNYQAGGMAVVPHDCGLLQVYGMQEIGGNSAAGALLFSYNTTNNTIQAFYPTGGGAASPASLSDPAITAGATAVTSAAANGSADLTPGRGKEVAAATDLSSVTIRCAFFGE